MRRHVAIASLCFAWICANGAIWDAAQVFAWGKMFAGYAQTMSVTEALRATFDPENRLVVRVAWTHGRFRFDADPRYGNNTLAGLPPHLIRGELTWENARGWYAGPTFEWAPRKTFIDFRNTYAADAYAIAGARVGRRAAKGLSWFVEGRNLLDNRYAATTGVIEAATGTDQAQFLPGDGRAVYGGIEFRW